MKISLFELVLYILPIVFIFHDFEEIIFFKPWIKKNRSWLRNQYPKLSERLIPHFESLSVQAFAFMVWEECMILGIAVVIMITTNFYFLAVAAFMAFAIHIVVHIIQWFFIRKYIPVLITSLLSLPYCIWGFMVLMKSISLVEIVICTLAGGLFMVINLYLIHRLAVQFDKKYNTLL